MRVVGHKRDQPCPKCEQPRFCDDCGTCEGCGHAVELSPQEQADKDHERRRRQWSRWGWSLLWLPEKCR